MKKILVCEDEAAIRDFVVINLRRAGYEVVEADCGEMALQKYEDNNGDFDVAILDIMMPGIDGLQVCKELRNKNSGIGIIMLSARTQEMDKVTGLMLGADDYITKPFNILEVKARMKAILRRSNKKNNVQDTGKTIVKGDMQIDCESRRVVIAGREINLTAKEFDLLELLAMNPNKVYSRENLLNIVWGYEYPGDARTVDVHIRRLREKVEANPSDPKYVYTKWGVGYYFKG